MNTERHPDDATWDAGREGSQTARALIAHHAASGMPVDRIALHHETAAADLLSTATTTEGMAWAEGYLSAAEAAVTELREAGHQGGATAPADGWSKCSHGILTADREAG